ncbi:hypothetical protein FF36_05872 [Frankia torreyi]|uniref:Uncharacterized protein n=1 Tax=Frankia torreyi TaxID=1856 RepID=A0A0D8B8Z1_9ACTN|nr:MULTISPECIES: hypothetical protein [Frankia]KJE19842.1 hypothetical protein FF36_05872 [Frankia torreyi]KQC36934.1 hypothetical protein UK82_18250 [Frankia sp. ACN1ag]KQM02163.1 hypothetical protein FF86_107810 [Frankia sp. CpI1-P]
MGVPTDLPASGLPLEAPDADAAEQAREVRPPTGAPPVPPAPPSEADEFDVVEQSIVVETDEDDYYR